jgi:acyl-coenzyme A thioesterase PaaI-like protein
VHGGVVGTLVDFAMGGALTSLLGPGERCATLEVKINYLARGAWPSWRRGCTVKHSV